MTAAAWALLVVAAVLAVVDWIGVARGSRALEYVGKPGALAALVLVALTLDPADGSARTWFVVALVLSLAGDVFLMLPRDRFVEGLASFLLAHVAYVVGFTARRRSSHDDPPRRDPSRGGRRAARRALPAAPRPGTATDRSSARSSRTWR